MAQNLNINEGVVSFASTETAWHGLGQIVEGVMTSEEAIKLAHLDYDVAKSPCVAFNTTETGINEIILPDKFMTYRTDLNQGFGVVGSRYEIVQNKDAFKFFDAIVGEGIAMYETAGALGKGERIFLSAKLPDVVTVEGLKDDVTEMYILLTSTHDGSGSIKALITPVRVVCENTLNGALREHFNKVSIRHTKNVQTNLENAHKLLGITHKYIAELNTCFSHLAKKKVSDEVVVKLIANLFKSQKEDSTRLTNIRNEVFKSYQEGVGQEKILGTAWGVYNGITYYLDHIKGYKNADKKFESITDGGSAQITQVLLEQLIKL